MRGEGTLRSWNEERGYGFIHPRGGGEDVFVHISAFRTRKVRPALNQVVTFDVEPGQNGRMRAKNVDQVLPEDRGPLGLSERRQYRNAVDWLALLAFLALYAQLAVWYSVAEIFAAVYVVASVATMLVYTIDKRAATQGGWRVSEGVLLLLGLVGGWPGAIVAQQWLRHKSLKASFRRWFWATVLLNVAGFVLWHSVLKRP